MPQLEPALQPQHNEHRHHEYGLQLEAERHRHAHHRAYRSVIKREAYRKHGKRHVYAVALTPERAVEIYCGKKQYHEEAEQLTGPAALYYADESCGGVGEDDVEQNAQQLDEVQIAYAGIGEQREEIEIRNVIVADRVFQRREAAVYAEIFHPAGEKGLIIERLTVQHEQAKRHSADYEERGDQYIFFPFEQTETAKKPQRSGDLKGSDNKNPKIHKHLVNRASPRN